MYILQRNTYLYLPNHIHVGEPIALGTGTLKYLLYVSLLSIKVFHATSKKVLCDCIYVFLSLSCISFRGIIRKIRAISKSENPPKSSTAFSTLTNFCKTWACNDVGRRFWPFSCKFGKSHQYLFTFLINFWRTITFRSESFFATHVDNYSRNHSFLFSKQYCMLWNAKLSIHIACSATVVWNKGKGLSQEMSWVLDSIHGLIKTGTMVEDDLYIF